MLEPSKRTARLRTLFASGVFSFLQYRIGFLFFALSLLLSNCAPRAPLQPVLPPPVSPDLAAQLLASLDSRRQTLTSLRGLARVVYTDPQEKGTAKQAIAVETPNNFRLELFSPVGIGLLTTCDGHTLAAYFPQEKALYRGAATPANIARFIRIPLSSRDITGLLLGLPVLPAHGDVNSVRLDPDTEWYQLTLSFLGQETYVLWFERQNLLLMRWETRTNEGTVLARGILADYRKVHNLYFPFEITLSDLQTKQEASIYYERVETNLPLPDSLFTLGSIPGVQEINVDALAEGQAFSGF